MTPNQLDAFLLVATDPGHGSTEYAWRLGVEQGVVSQILETLGQRGRTKAGRFDLVISEFGSGDVRRQQFYLTSKGRALFKRIQSHLRIMALPEDAME